ncbi:MAG: YjjG family noncanonical pyrimidine nucleotidase [Bacteroidia bacterium]|jgi:putative hydrolase of the HAD superfamily|nr:YjjG family noncanonical pyrimidine nucleotidase [Bacteroidia bacterium]
MIGLRTKKHIFFDLDDTLWDYQHNSDKVLRELFAEYALNEKLRCGVKEFLEEYKRVNLLFWSLYGKGKLDKIALREQRFQETFKRFNYESKEDGDALTQTYLARAPKGRQLKQGCLETLSYLKRNYTLHIITNGFKEVQGIKIDSGGLRNFFDCIIVTEEHGFNKPDERIFRVAEQLTGAQTKDCVMIGDHLENDVYGAKNAGWDAIHLDNEGTAEFNGVCIRELPELKNWF